MKIKSIISLIVIILLLAACKQTKKAENSLTVSGTITGVADGTPVFCTYENGIPAGKCNVIKGKFEIPFSIEKEPCNIRLRIVSGNIENETSFFVGKNSVVVDFNIDSIDNRKVIGSLYEDEISAYHDYYMKNKLNVYDLQQKIISDKDKMSKAELSKTFHTIDSMESCNQTVVKNYIRNHHDNFASVLALDNEMDKLPKDTTIALFKQLNPKYKLSQSGISISEYISQPKIVEEGDDFIDFEAIDKNDKTHKLSEIKGKYILLEFTSVHCYACVNAKKELAGLHQKYVNNLDIVSFYVDDDKSDWLKSLKEDKTQWLCLWDGKGDKSPTHIAYGVGGIPMFYLINPKGKVVKKWTGYGYPPIEVKIGKYIY